jgi:hypothetical protein
MAMPMGLSAVGTVLIDGTKIDASASKIKTVRQSASGAFRTKSRV